MTKNEAEILRYLKMCYTGARMLDDMPCMVRLARAIAVFNANPLDAPEGIFTEKFLESYWMDAETESDERGFFDES